MYKVETFLQLLSHTRWDGEFQVSGKELVMRKSLWFACLGSLLMCASALVPALAQDFHKTYPMEEGQISIHNISGDVKVVGYTGDSIVVDAYKVGPDRDQVTIEDTSSQGRLDLRVHYAAHHHTNAGVNFEVKVPQAFQYNFDKIESVSGNVTVQDVKGRMRAQSVSGSVEVRGLSGMVSASSISGSVDVEIAAEAGAGEMKFSSISGNVSVRAPRALDADIEMSTISGSLKCDFPIEIREPRYGPGRSARGRLGNGTNNLRITSVSGRVSLTQF